MTYFAPWTGYTLPMNVIYADSLLAVNFIINYLILLLTARVCSLPLRRGRFALGAAAGAAYALAAVFPAAGFLLLWPMKLVTALVMCLAAFGTRGSFWRYPLVFLALSAAFGGTVYAAGLALGLPAGQPLYIPVSLRVLAVSFAVCYGALNLLFRRSAQRLRRKITPAEVHICGKAVTLHALRDTGNELFSPADGKGVMVAHIAAVAELFPPGTAGLLREKGAVAFVEEMSALPEFRGRLTLIPYRAVGCGGALMAAVRPDSIILPDRDSGALLLGLSPTPLGTDGEFSAIY